MIVSRLVWNRYITKLSKINNEAARVMTEWVEKNGLDNVYNLVSEANAISYKYGEAAAALAAEMYDAIAEASGAIVPSAVPADPAEYGEIAAAVQASAKEAPSTIPSVVARYVKRAAADTTLYNAERDGAQFAWIPHGDTCAFCITLASRGWQYMSKSALKNGHAEHIHSNCDCEYAIRFSDRDNVAGYYPEKYYKVYHDAEGATPRDKINFMRREFYAETGNDE